MPDCELDDIANLSVQMRKLNMNLEQIQDFTPTPMTLASVMFYTGFDPYTNEKIYIPRSAKEKKIQPVIFSFFTTGKSVQS